jgi:carbon monoxide dehydrogenase subunit G
MQLEHDFVVPAPVDQAWTALLDIERVAPCMPGATLESIDGDTFTGKVKVKVGPIQVTYGGTARFVEKDEQAHSAVIEASGKESRGAGTAQATIRANLAAEGSSSTKVKVVTDLAITGKPAQFGRGVLNDVGAKILGLFADCLASQLAGPAAGSVVADSGGTTGTVPAADAAKAALATEPGTGTGTAAGSSGDTGDRGAWAAATEPVASAAAGPRLVQQPLDRPTPDAIDLIDTAGAPLAKRIIPVVAAVLVVLVIWKLLRRRGG